MIKSVKQMIEALPQPLELQEEPESEYTILKDIGSMSGCYREPRARRITTKNHACIEIQSAVKLLQGDKTTMAVMFTCMIQSTGGSTNGGRIKATRDRYATAKDIQKLTGMSRNVVSSALKKLDNLGLVRGYRTPEDGRVVYYRINPLYWAGISGKSGRKIDWIDWILFADELSPFLDEETVKNLNNMAYTQWIKNYSR